jgi:hypothetical protein
LVGRGGSSQSPQPGAFILPHDDSLDFDLERFNDVPDTLERTEEVDSRESRLELCSVGRLGGRTGRCRDDCRFGSGGGGGFDPSAPLCMIGGGNSLSAFVPFGKLPNVVSVTEPFICSRGLLKVLCRCGIDGLWRGTSGFGRVGG